MIRLGASQACMRQPDQEDTFTARVQLLIIMAKAYLKQFPLGSARKQAVGDNARCVFYESLRRVAELNAQKGPGHCLEPATSAMTEEMIHLQRIQLLAVMMQSIAEGNPMGHYRRRALEENIDRISNNLTGDLEVPGIALLKVA